MRPAVRGFSLVETIISIGLLTGGLATFAHVIAISIGTNAMAAHRTRSAIFAEQRMEQLRAEPTLDDVSHVVEYLDASGVGVCSGSGACEGIVYVRRVFVSPVSIAPSAVLVQVRVRHVRSGYGEIRLVTLRPRTLR